ncbi:MAG: hypothetical protein GY719_32765 [bacterium]|nr:hypothetical protein [bacterium]
MLLNPLEHRFVLDGFRQLLPVDSGVEAHLRGVLRDVLAHPGSLIRAQLAYAILRQHGVEAFAARSTAIAIEYFHTASLIFDDMPNMDDAAERRGHACPHLVYGEAAATLGALALINQGYALLWQVIGVLGEAGRRAASELVSSCLGLGGILNGQARDLHFGGGEGGQQDVLEVAEGKTVTLIRLTLVLPAIVAGVSEADRARLDRLAAVWGIAYQILDDFKDCLMSRAETGKSSHRDHRLGRPNFPGVSGSDRAMEKLSELLAEGRDILAALSADAGRWGCLGHVQSILEAERRKVRLRMPVAACA